MKTMQGKKKNILITNQYKFLELLPIILTLFFIPIIVFLKISHVGEEYFRIWTPQHEFFDFFSYYKSFYLFIFSVFAFFMFIARILKKA